jgi:hypothetical protein
MQLPIDPNRPRSKNYPEKIESSPSSVVESPVAEPTGVLFSDMSGGYNNGCAGRGSPCTNLPVMMRCDSSAHPTVSGLTGLCYGDRGVDVCSCGLRLIPAEPTASKKSEPATRSQTGITAIVSGFSSLIDVPLQKRVRPSCRLQSKAGRCFVGDVWLLISAQNPRRSLKRLISTEGLRNDVRSFWAYSFVCDVLWEEDGTAI